MYRLVASVLLVMAPSLAMDNLQVAYQWKKIEFAYPTENERQHALNTGEYIPENNLPVGLEVFEDRLFITIPRWKRGVAASLAYIKLSEAVSDSPPLYPYPDWDSHHFPSNGELPQIVSPFRIRADRCGRLWVLDSGYVDILEDKSKYKPKYNTSYVRPKLLVYDLHHDKLLRTYLIPEGQMHHENSVFANIAVEDHDCDNTFAYLADLGHPALVVYSYRSQKSWMVQYRYFHIDPRARAMHVAGDTFEWSDGLLGLALSSPDPEGYSTLYFHPLNSFDEFAVDTKMLRDESFATNTTAKFHEFRRLGSRGAKGQSGASFLDQKSQVLFFTSVNLNAVSCWRTSLNYTTNDHGWIFMDNETMVFPNDVKVDASGNLWVLSDKMTLFIHSYLNFEEYNFRIFKGRVADVIKGTVCDSSSGERARSRISWIFAVTFAFLFRWILK